MISYSTLRTFHKELVKELFLFLILRIGMNVTLSNSILHSASCRQLFWHFRLIHSCLGKKEWRSGYGIDYMEISIS